MFSRVIRTKTYYGTHLTNDFLFAMKYKTKTLKLIEKVAKDVI